MNILCDYRENACIQLLQKTIPEKIHTTNLQLGDFHICDSSNNPIIIVERKTVEDLYASVKDGRYLEQSKRLISYRSENPVIIMYIIENAKKPYTDLKLLYSCMYSLQMKKGFWCWRTKNCNETCEVICQISKKIIKDGIHTLPQFNQTNHSTSHTTNHTTNSDNTQNPEFSETLNYNECVLKTKKNENITPDNISVFMLSQIPYISFKQAEVIMNHFQTIEKLIEFLKENMNDINKIDTFVRLDKNRRLSKRVKENLYKYILRV